MDSTIVIPTFNRANFLSTCLQHLVNEFDQTGVGVLVLDGSDEECAEQNQALCKRLNVSYRHYHSTISVIQRMNEGMQYVSTRFSSFAADDDFLFAPGYLESVKFLKNNLEYVAAHGSYVERLQRGENQVIERPIYTNVCPTHSNSWLERGYDFLSNYIPVIYAVHRTAVLRSAYGRIPLAVDSQDYTLGELYSALLTALQGKIQKCDLPFCSRIRQGSGYVPSWQYIHQPQFSDRYQRMKNALIEQFKDRVSNDELLATAIDMMFNGFWGKTAPDSRERFLRLIGKAGEIHA